MNRRINENPNGIELTRSNSHERPDCHEECGTELCAVCGCKAHKPWKKPTPEHPDHFNVNGEDVFLCAEHQRFTERRLGELLAEIREATSPAERKRILEAHSGPMATHKRPPRAVARSAGKQ